MGLQVVVGPVGDALELVPSPGKEELDVGGGGRVVGELLGLVVAQPQLRLGDAEAEVPGEALLEPVLEPLSAPRPGGTKYSISICSNSRVRKTKFCGVISLRNDLPTWAIPKGGFFRVVWSTLAKLVNMPWAVSGRR